MPVLPPLTAMFTILPSSTKGEQAITLSVLVRKWQARESYWCMVLNKLWGPPGSCNYTLLCRASGRLALGLASAALFAVGCPGSTARKPDAAPQAATGPDPLQGGEIVFDGGDKGDWHESGSVVHDDTGPGPARVHFGTGAESIFTRVGLTGTFGAVVFRVKEPAGEAEFLEVRQSPSIREKASSNASDILDPLASLRIFS